MVKSFWKFVILNALQTLYFIMILPFWFEGHWRVFFKNYDMVEISVPKCARYVTMTEVKRILTASLTVYTRNSFIMKTNLQKLRKKLHKITFHLSLTKAAVSPRYSCWSVLSFHCWLSVDIYFNLMFALQDGQF